MLCAKQMDSNEMMDTKVCRSMNRIAEVMQKHYRVGLRLRQSKIPVLGNGILS